MPPADSLVFSYGSNMPAARILARAPSAERVATGYVTHRRLAFHKRGADGSAKADAALTASESDRVWGVVYSLSTEDKRVLDAHESLGVGYDEEEVAIHTAGEPVRAWMYVARAEVIDESLRPFSWYHLFVVKGAEQNGLPADYIRAIREIETIPDPDRSRHADNMRLIEP